MALSRAVGNMIAQARALGSRGVWRIITGHSDEAEESLQEALALRREIADHAGVAMSNANVGMLAFLNGDFGEANALARKGLKIATDTRNPNGRTAALHVLGRVAIA
jgi:hypothetical protein